MYANTAVAGAMKGATKAMSSMNKVCFLVFSLHFGSNNYKISWFRCSFIELDLSRTCLNIFNSILAPSFTRVSN